MGNVITNRNASRLEFERLLVRMTFTEIQAAMKEPPLSYSYRIAPNSTCVHIMYHRKCNDVSNVGMIIPGHEDGCRARAMFIPSNFSRIN